MYLAMNRFRVRQGQEAAFEDLWLSREVYLHTVPGFLEFRLLKGPEVAAGDGGGAQVEPHRLYASHTMWESEEAFRAWTRSQAFRDAHKGAGGHAHLYVGGPALELFDTLQRVKRDGTRQIVEDARTPHDAA